MYILSKFCFDFLELFYFCNYVSGKKFAEMELKAAISTIILKYDIKPCAKTEIPLKFKGGSIPLHTLCGLWVNLAKRKIQVSF